MFYSDGPTPEKQSEQILAVYPILKGQKPDTRNAIPPRGSVSGPSSHPPQAVQHPVEQRPSEDRQPAPPAATQPAPPAVTQPEPSKGDDLIDFGQNEPKLPVLPPAQPLPETKPEVRPAIDAQHKSTADIQSMLSQTGSPAPGGPLIDFHQDMKTTLPTSLKRESTAESSDEFVDAQE